MAIRITGHLILTAALCLGAAQSARSFEATSDQQEACTPDAFRLCSAEIPDADRVAACLDANVAKLSPACGVVIRTALAARSMPREHWQRHHRRAHHHFLHHRR
jgi:hypothetical protein